MTFLDSLVQTSWAQALGYALAHSIWEGAVAALVLLIVFQLLRQSAARGRYAAASIVFFSLPVAFALTFWIVFAGAHPSASPFPRPAWVRGLSVIPADAGAVTAASSWTAFLPWLTPVWMTGAALWYLRAFAGGMAVHRLRRVAVCSAETVWQLRLRALRQELRISRGVLLLESALAEVPVVIGFFRPVILMPLGLLTGFPAEHVEAFLIHELAHIRRCDYLVNLAQTFVEGFFFYHPAVWWISAQVRAERENCCDDAVVALTGDARGYATALTTLEESRWRAAEPALAATGGPLMKRVHRLLSPSQPRLTAGPVIGLLFVSACLALAAHASRKPAPAPQDAASVQHPVVPRASEAASLLAEPGASAGGRPESHSQLKEDTVYIITDAERQAFRRLQTDAEREQFIEQLRRSHKAKPVRLLAQAVRPPEPAAQTPYQKWLTEDVAYIITDAERQAFRRLQTDAERDNFIVQFWLRRDPTPGTPLNEFKVEHYRRIVYANAHFRTSAGLAGWKTDRGRIYIVFGPPDEIDSHPEGGPLNGQNISYPFEDWRYRYIQGVGNDVLIQFEDKARTGEYHMTMDPAGGGKRVENPAGRGGGPQRFLQLNSPLQPQQ